MDVVKVTPSSTSLSRDLARDSKVEKEKVARPKVCLHPNSPVMVTAEGSAIVAQCTAKVANCQAKVASPVPVLLPGGDPLQGLAPFQRLRAQLPWWQAHSPQFVVQLITQGVEPTFWGGGVAFKEAKEIGRRIIFGSGGHGGICQVGSCKRGRPEKHQVLSTLVCHHQKGRRSDKEKVNQRLQRGKYPPKDPKVSFGPLEGHFPCPGAQHVGSQSRPPKRLFSFGIVQQHKRIHSYGNKSQSVSDGGQLFRAVKSTLLVDASHAGFPQKMEVKRLTGFHLPRRHPTISQVEDTGSKSGTFHAARSSGQWDANKPQKVTAYTFTGGGTSRVPVELRGGGSYRCPPKN